MTFERLRQGAISNWIDTLNARTLILLFRYFVTTAAGLYFLLGTDHRTGRHAARIAITLGLVLFVTIFETVRIVPARRIWSDSGRRSGALDSDRTSVVGILIDIALVSYLYYLSDDPRSELYVFYYLPMLVASEVLAVRKVFLTSLAVGSGLSLALYFQTPNSNWMGRNGLFLTVLLPRLTFLFVSFATIAVLLLKARRSHQVSVESRKQLSGLAATGGQLDRFIGPTEAVRKLLLEGSLRLSAIFTALILQDRQTGEWAVAEKYGDKTVLHNLDPYLLKIATDAPETLVQNITGKSLNVPERASITVLSTPLFSRTGALGCLCVGRTFLSDFSEAEASFSAALAGQISNVIEVDRLVTALSEVTRKTLEVVTLERTLEQLLHKTTDVLHFEFATVSLVDPYRNVIEMYRARHIPPGWMRRSKYHLSEKTIHPWIVAHGESQIIEGFDERLNRDIYDRYQHQDLVRIFVPIKSRSGRVLGTIQAGGRRERRAELLKKESLSQLDQMAAHLGVSIAEMHPSQLALAIAQQAIKVVGAQSGGVYMFDDSTLMLAAWDGIDELVARTEGAYFAVHSEIMPYELFSSANGSLAEFGLPPSIKTLLAIALNSEERPRGILCLHFTREIVSTSGVVELAIVFARQMALAMRSHFMLRDLSLSVESHSSGFSMQRVLSSLVSSETVESVLGELAQLIVHQVDADNVTIYPFLPHAGRLAETPIQRGVKIGKPSPGSESSVTELFAYMSTQSQPVFAQSALNSGVLSKRRADGKPRFVEREAISSCAVFRLSDPTRTVVGGLMFVNYVEPKVFDVETRRMLMTLASSAAVAIHLAELRSREQDRLRRKELELDALRAIDDAIIQGTVDSTLTDVFELILRKALTITGATAGNVMWLRPWDKVLEAKAHHGLTDVTLPFRQSIEEGLVGLVAREGRSRVVADVRHPEWSSIYKKIVSDTRSELAVPLVDRSGVLGVINLEHPTPERFSDNDRELVETFALEAVIALHSVSQYISSEHKVKALRALSTVSEKLIEVGHDLTTALHVILTGVTASDGLGFSRALVFLDLDQTQTLRGVAGVGPATAFEAQSRGLDLDAGTRELRESGTDALRALVGRSASLRAKVASGEAADTPLNIAVCKMALTSHYSAEDRFAQSIVEGRSVIVKRTDRDLLRGRFSAASIDPPESYVVVPLNVGSQVRGLIIADNMFQPNRDTFESWQVDGLTAFAGLTAITIEKDELLVRLASEEHTRLSRDLASRVAHRIGTRISVMAGNLSRLKDELAKILTTQGIDECVGDLGRAVGKAKALVSELRRFAVLSDRNLREVDLVGIVQAVVTEAQRGLACPVAPDLPKESVIVSVDVQTISDALLEILDNATQIFRANSTPSPQVRVILSTEMSGTAALARIQIIDNGPGIPYRDKDAIFEPHFTSKFGEGGGLGLAIVKLIVNAHHGRIFEAGVPGEGAQFVMLLPLSTQVKEINA